MPQILLLELLHAPQFTYAHPDVDLLSTVERLLGYAHPSAASAIRWRCCRSGLIKKHHDFIRTLTKTNPDLTLDEIRDALAARGAMKSGGRVNFD